MIIKITDVNNNRITMADVEAIRQRADGTIIIIPVHETIALHINGVEIMQSERPTFDSRIIINMELLV